MRLVGLYRSPFSRLAESYAAYERRERDENGQAAALRFEQDRRSILALALEMLAVDAPAGEALGRALGEAVVQRYAGGGGAGPGDHHANRIRGALSALAGMDSAQDWPALGAAIAGILGTPAQAGADRPAPDQGERGGVPAFEADRRRLVRAILDQVLDRALAPRFYDYDYIDDVVGVVATRYCSDAGSHAAACASILGALSVLAGSGDAFDWRALPQALRRVLGTDHGYVPPRGDVTRHVWDVIPDLAAEFIGLKAEDDPERFLQINREYSRRQAVSHGLWDNRELSLLRGYERDHHLLLRTLIELQKDGQLSAADEVLLVGPRFVDEVDFFRHVLGLRRTIGLDLFEYGGGRIVAGDMHRMPFASGRFRLVYCAGTLSYAYDVRRVIAEMARVTTRPGFVFLVDAAGRRAGPDALGRSDVMGIDTLIGLFHRNAFSVLARDAGRSLAPERYDNEPCLALRLDDRASGFPGSTDLTRYLATQG